MDPILVKHLRAAFGGVLPLNVGATSLLRARQMLRAVGRSERRSADAVEGKPLFRSLLNLAAGLDSEGGHEAAMIAARHVHVAHGTRGETSGVQRMV